MRALWISVLTSACVSGTTAPTLLNQPIEVDSKLVSWGEPLDNPRPADSPDVLLITVAGHNAFTGAEYNAEYLQSSALTDSLSELFVLRGKTIQTEAFTDEFFGWEQWNGETSAKGFLELTELLDRVQTYWMADYDNPTRVIVIGHGHGVVWAHLAAHLRPIPIDVLVDLDGQSDCWETPCLGVGDVWGSLIPEWSAFNEVVWDFDVSTAKDAIVVSGLAERYDIQDVTPANATYNFEFHARGHRWPFQNDHTPNLRADGSRTGVFSNTSVEHHDDIYQPWSDAIQTVSQALEGLYFSEE